ncbi:MAG: ABC transporter ATP-binding protein [Alphaproteobacteria bacterium]
MATVEVRSVTKSFGQTEVLREVDLDVGDGEFVVLLGPSGCGKSTLLNIIAGLETLNEGEIRIDDEVVNDVEPKDRNIAMVFQSYALYPAMTVRNNITFGLKQRKVSREEIENSLARFSKMLQVDQLLERKPAQLSGGQRQRVAMGRALVREPHVFLFDEPLSNLDAKLRVEMRQEIKKLHERLGTTMIYVTHDQIEAMSLATRIAVMNEGIIQQIGTPLEIYDTPNSVFVADFVGSPAINLLSGTLEQNAGAWTFVGAAAGKEVRVPVNGAAFKSPPSAGSPVTLGIRPEHIANSRHSDNSAEYDVSPILIELTGYDQNVTFDFFGSEIVARLPRNTNVKVGENTRLYLDVSEVSIFDGESGRRI